MRKNAPKYPFLTILDILTSAQFGGIYIMSILFATKRKVAKIPTLRPTLQLLPHIAPQARRKAAYFFDFRGVRKMLDLLYEKFDLFALILSCVESA